MKRTDLSLFFSALLQVALVAMNVVFISKGYLLLLLITGAGISLFWTFNVKRASFGGWRERLIYTAGATVGTGLGYWLAKVAINYF
jgi:hypothetical protein